MREGCGAPACAYARVVDIEDIEAGIDCGARRGDEAQRTHSATELRYIYDAIAVGVPRAKHLEHARCISADLTEEHTGPRMLGEDGTVILRRWRSRVRLRHATCRGHVRGRARSRRTAERVMLGAVQ